MKIKIESKSRIKDLLNKGIGIKNIRDTLGVEYFEIREVQEELYKSRIILRGSK